jgi:hypothetical protein
MSRTSKYGKCIEKFDVKFHLRLFGIMGVGLAVFTCVISEGGSFGPYFTILGAFGLTGTLIFWRIPNSPKATCLLACTKGLVYKAGLFSPLFLRWEEIDGFSTKEHGKHKRLFVVMNESAGMGKEWEFSMELSLPAHAVATRLTEIWSEQRSDLVHSIES